MLPSIMDENMSEIARIKRQIQAEYNAAYQALHGFGIVAQHRVVTKHLENMSKHGDALADIVGNEEAMQFLVDVMQDQEEIERLFAEYLGIPSYFERFRRRK